MAEANGEGPQGPGLEALSDLVQALPAVVYAAEPGAEGTWHYVSAHVEALLGYTPDEWMADRSLYVRSLHPEDREAVVRIEERELEAARSGDVTAVSEYRMLRRDGSVVWIRDEARLASEDGRTIWQGVLIDITAERALTEAYDHYRSLVESLPACLYRSESGPTGRWEFLSPQIESLVGHSAAVLMSDPSLRAGLVHPEDQEWVFAEEAEGAAASPGTQWVREYRLLHRAGELIWVRDRGMVSLAQGNGRTVEGILTDITAARTNSASEATVPDVYRVSCPRCGSVWAAERVEACAQCGNSDVDAVSLDATVQELAGVRSQLDGLLDGIQGHLETLKTSLPEAPRASAPPARSSGARLRVVTPLHEDEDVL
jgi:PAS domain S-box-containing protein